MPATTHPRIVNAKELAEILGVRVARIYRWSSDGRIPKLKIGNCLRFDVDAVLAWAKSDSRVASRAGPADDLDAGDLEALHDVLAGIELEAL